MVIRRLKLSIHVVLTRIHISFKGVGFFAGRGNRPFVFGSEIFDFAATEEFVHSVVSATEGLFCLLAYTDARESVL